MNKKVCIVTASPSTVDAFLRKHIDFLSENNRVSVVSGFDKSDVDNVGRGSKKAIDISRNINVFSDVRSVLNLFYFFREEKFDIVISVTPKAGLLAMLTAFLCRVPVRIHWYTGQVWVTKTGFFRRFLKFFDQLIAVVSTHLLADSNSQMEFLLSEGVVRRGKIGVLSAGSISGVNAKKFLRNDQMRFGLRKDMQLSDSDVLFLFLGRMNRDKGVLDLARAFSNLAAESSNVKLVFVGPDEEQITDEIKQICNKCCRHVSFYGYTNVPEKYLSAADVFVLPSYREGFGTSVIEAAAAGIPCVGTRIYGLTDAIEEGVTGILVEPGNVSQLKDAISKLAESDKTRLLMGKKAQLRAVEQFNDDNLSAEFVRYVEYICR